MGTHKLKYKETRRKGKKHRQLQAIHIGDSATSALAEHAHSTAFSIDWTAVHAIITHEHEEEDALKAEQSARNTSSSVQFITQDPHLL